MNKIKDYIKSDFKATIFLAINNIIRKIIISSSSFYMQQKLHLMGVTLGRNTKWGGIAQIERFPKSKITIGNDCTFNSINIFNQRGIKRCIIQTGKIGAKIHIGNNCGFSGVSIVADSEIEIQNNVKIGANSLIGDRDDHPEILGTQPSKITIKNNVFIGMQCIILKGVTIGENTIIGAGSIVTKDIPSNVIAAGIPCKVIKKKNN